MKNADQSLNPLEPNLAMVKSTGFRRRARYLGKFLRLQLRFLPIHPFLLYLGKRQVAPALFRSG
jgi:hypothetical protein